MGRTIGTLYLLLYIDLPSDAKLENGGNASNFHHDRISLSPRHKYNREIELALSRYEKYTNPEDLFKNHVKNGSIEEPRFLAPLGPLYCFKGVVVQCYLMRSKKEVIHRDEEKSLLLLAIAPFRKEKVSVIFNYFVPGPNVVTPKTFNQAVDAIFAGEEREKFAEGEIERSIVVDYSLQERTNFKAGSFEPEVDSLLIDEKGPLSECYEEMRSWISTIRLDHEEIQELLIDTGLFE